MNLKSDKIVALVNFLVDAIVINGEERRYSSLGVIAKDFDPETERV